MERYRIEVGHQHQVKPGNIVGAIANEAGLDAHYIGHIDIQEEFSLVDLPAGMPQDIYQDLKKAWVCGQQLNITRQKPSVKKPGKSPRKGKKRSKSD
jgi:ATP-dependent RNA helicase DeaD